LSRNESENNIQLNILHKQISFVIFAPYTLIQLIYRIIYVDQPTFINYRKISQKFLYLIAEV